MSELKKQIAALPKEPGIYQFYDEKYQLLYVGKSVSLRNRVSSYFTAKNLGPKTSQLVSKIANIKYIQVFSEFEALLLEAKLIRKYMPFYNSAARDDKSPIYIKITSDSIPLITLTRKEKPERGTVLYGPFPSTKIAKNILKLIRRIFPYCQHKNAKKPCLYVHLGLCPFPYAGDEAKEDYLKNVAKIKRLLAADSKTLIRQLLSEMTTAAKYQKFEEAQVTKKQLEQLSYLTTTYHNPDEFLKSPNLVDDLTIARLEELKKVLKLPKIPRRIECYDISNIQGKSGAGSMVVFTGGKKDKSQYRRFKIKLLDTPNDYFMHQEVMTRRLKNDWPKPDLFIIDGGRGQLTAVAKVLQKFNLDIPIVGLAKRLEEIYTLNVQTPISLPKENKARQLVQEIRDEAHRFAITYHKLLRSKQFLPK